MGTRRRFSTLQWQRAREIGRQIQWDHAYQMAKTCFVSILNLDNACSQPVGAVYNFDFSPLGCTLVSVCERECFVVIDPWNRKIIKTKFGAHESGVNCVRFIGDRQFVTSSDDQSVKLWDLRKLSSPLKTFVGHENWVKNVEYDEEEKVLVTSGFDGRILMWDLKNNHENVDSEPTQLFESHKLVRCKMTRNHGYLNNQNLNKKMAITTNEGFVIIIHDLDLSNFKQDLSTFYPGLFRLHTPSISMETHPYFKFMTRKRNRVEFLLDYEDDDVTVVSSVDFNPHGNLLLTRSNNLDGWTMLTNNPTIHPFMHTFTYVHDISGDVYSLAYPSFRNSPSSSSSSSSSSFSISSSSSSFSTSLWSPIFKKIATRRIRSNWYIDRHYGQVHNNNITTPSYSNNQFQEHNNPDHLNHSNINTNNINHNDNSINNNNNNDSEDEYVIETFDFLNGVSHQLSDEDNDNENNLNTVNKEAIKKKKFIKSQYLLSPHLLTNNKGLSNQSHYSNYNSFSFIYNHQPTLCGWVAEGSRNHGYLEEICFGCQGRVVCLPRGKGLCILGFDSKAAETPHQFTKHSIYCRNEEAEDEDEEEAGRGSSDVFNRRDSNNNHITGNNREREEEEEEEEINKKLGVGKVLSNKEMKIIRRKGAKMKGRLSLTTTLTPFVITPPSHPSDVICCQHSPWQPLVVSGCCQANISFNQFVI